MATKLCRRACPLVCRYGHRLSGEVIIFGQFSSYEHLGVPHIVRVVGRTAKIAVLHILGKAIVEMEVAVPISDAY